MIGYRYECVAQALRRQQGQEGLQKRADERATKLGRKKSGQS